MALEIFRAITNLRMVLDSETDHDSPNSELTYKAMREMIEILYQLSLDTGDSGTATANPTETTLTDSGAAYDVGEHNGRTLVICSGLAKGKFYTIDDTTATTIVCTGDTLLSDGVLSGDDYKILYDIKTHASGHNHDGVNSAERTVADGQITEAKLGTSAVTTTKLKTAAVTSGVSGSLSKESGVNISLQDYCYFPNIYSISNDVHVTGYGTDNAVTTARFGLYNTDTNNTRAYEVSYRYGTSTDKPFLHAIRDIATGEILHVWMCSDPPPEYWGLDELPEDYEAPIILSPRPEGLEDIVIHKYPLEDYIEVFDRSKKDKRLLHEIINQDYDFKQDKKMFTPKNLRAI